MKRFFFNEQIKIVFSLILAFYLTSLFSNWLGKTIPNKPIEIVYLVQSSAKNIADDVVSGFSNFSKTLTSFQFGLSRETSTSDLKTTASETNTSLKFESSSTPSSIPGKENNLTPANGLNPLTIPTTGFSLKTTITPTIKPTTSTPKSIPTPTPATKIPNYAKLISLVNNPPQIGCYGGTTTNCPVDSLYQTYVDKGLGFSTYYGDEHSNGYNVVADVIHYNKRITLSQAQTFIDSTFISQQSNITPEEAKKTGKVIAYGATRSPKDLWKIKYLFGVDDPKNPKPYFIGRVMIIDCAKLTDWSGYLATLLYSRRGWNNLNWIVDLSKNGFVQLPLGISGRKDNTNEGRPGVILIDESILDSMIY